MWPIQIKTNLYTYSIALKPKVEVQAVFDEMFRAFMPLTCMRGGWKWWLYWKETGFYRMQSKLATGLLARFSCQTCCVRSDRLSALVHLRSSVSYQRFVGVVFRSYNELALLLIRGWRSILVRINSLTVRTDVCLTQHEWSERDPVAFVDEYRKFDVHSCWRQYKADQLRSQATSKCPQSV